MELLSLIRENKDLITKEWVEEQNFALSSAIPQKLSDLTDDVVSGKYALIDGTVANAEKLGGKTLLVGAWNGIPSVAGGVMEIGRHIDFHYAEGTGLDYTTRLTAPIVDAPCIVTLPSSAGTLALLTSTVSSAKKLVAGDGTDAVYVAASGNVAIGQTADSGYKLDVNGTMRVRNSAVCANGLSVSHELWGESFIVNRSSIDGSAVITFKNNGGFLGWIGVGGSASSDQYKPIFSDRNYNNYVIIHSGIIGEQSVKEATKLKTARSIWGQSFDGSKDINGDAVIDGNLVVKGDIASA